MTLITYVLPPYSEGGFFKARLTFPPVRVLARIYLIRQQSRTLTETFPLLVFLT